MSGRGGSIKQRVHCSRRKQRDGGWGEPRTVRKNRSHKEIWYGIWQKNNTEPGINRFWIPVLELLYYIRVDFRKHIFIHALHKTQKEIYYDLYNWYYKWAQIKSMCHPASITKECGNQWTLGSVAITKWGKCQSVQGSDTVHSKTTASWQVKSWDQRLHLFIFYTPLACKTCLVVWSRHSNICWICSPIK